MCKNIYGDYINLYTQCESMEIQWNPSNVDTLGTRTSVLNREVSPFQG